jgi:hypothetical protein
LGLFDEVLDNVGKPFTGGGKGFEYGTHEVIIGTVEAKAKPTQKVKSAEIIEVVVFDQDDNDKKATCTLWFHTEGAAKMSVTKVLGLLVHKVPEDKKDAVRELGKKLFGSIDDTKNARDVAAKLMTDKLVGEKAYLVAEPQGTYSTTSYGDLWHYPAEPQNKPVTPVVAVAEDGTEPVDPADVPDFGEDL